MTEQDVSTAVEQNTPAAAEAIAAETLGAQTSTKDETQENQAEQADQPGEVEQAEQADQPGEVEPKGHKRSSALEREGEVAADFLEQLLDIADLDGDIDVDVDHDRAAVAIVDSEEGRVSRRLVGPDGKVLEALQELTRLAVQAATGERSRLMLDVAGHRAQRRAELVTIAQEAIGRVRETGENVAMEPMTAFERKVVHDTVLAGGLGSESEGVEPHRHVVILPA
ncbi:MAG: R3H domain-containing nucleic acid-binding protein [Actinomycetota bacterium]